MNLETQIHLDKFEPRDYQKPFIQHMVNGGKRAFLLWARRTGKDLCCWNIIIRAAIVDPGIYYYIFPNYSQARKALWDSSTMKGVKFLDFIPNELIASKNDQQMKLRLTNGSLIQVVGCENYNTLMGTNAKGMVFSEWALCEPMAFQYLQPVLLASEGWCVFNTTPRGKNHAYDTWMMANQNTDTYFVQKLTVEDAKHVPISVIEQEIKQGTLTEDMVLQEFYCSWDQGIQGAYYARYLDKMNLEGRICPVPWEPALPVSTSWDIGVTDATSIIFFQEAHGHIRIIDCYENSKHGIEHYVNVLKEKPYQYHKHIGPHDIRIKDFSSGITRWDKAKDLGVTFTVADKLSIMDGIEAVRSLLPKCYIDKDKCRPLVNALENYRQEWDTKHKRYKSQPLHNWSSHMADSMRYLAVSLPKIRERVTADEYEKWALEAQGYNPHNLPHIFRDDLPNF